MIFTSCSGHTRSSVTGTPLGEEDGVLLVKTAEPDPERIPLVQIAERTPEMSRMPPLGLVLPPQDLRDVVAYLKTLRVPAKP
jgi:hypothetical protein